MNTAIFSGTGTFSGIGFAIPSNMIAKIAPTFTQVTQGRRLNIRFSTKSYSPSGIYVDTITKDGPADKAGLHGSTTDQYSKKHVGDIIIDVDGHKIVRIDDLGSYIEQHKAVGDNRPSCTI